MATIDELLDSLLDGPVQQEDIDEAICVDPAARTLIVPTPELILGVTSDERAECKYFKMPRVVGNGVDVTACKLRVIYTNANGDTDYYTVKHCVNDDDAVVFCWELSRKVTAHAGDVKFSVCVCWTVDGTIEKEWNTTDAIGKVLPGHSDVTHEDLLPKPDVLEEIERLVNSAAQEAEAASNSAREAADTAKNLTGAVQTATSAASDASASATAANADAQKAAEAASKAEAALEGFNSANLNADKVVFPGGLKTTYPVGKVQLVNGMGTLVEPGGTLADFFNVFIDEKNPETVQPSVSLTFSQARAYEVGEKITPSYSASLNPGSYTYGPDTGVTSISWSIEDSMGNTSNTTSDSFPEIQVTDGISYTITAVAEHTAGAVPVTNTGKEYPAGQIAKGSTKPKVSGAVTGYRNTFYGTLTEKGTLDSGKIRGLNKSKKALADGSDFTITVPVGAMRVVFAYPATLRDVTSVRDDAMGMPIETGFTKSTMAVYGANGYRNEKNESYKVYVMDFAGPLDTANTYTVTI